MSMTQIMHDLTLRPDAGEEDRRLDAPAFHRNGPAIVEALSARLDAVSGDILEIGSGTGQHAVLFGRAFPHLTFWPSDPNPSHRVSIDAWRAHLAVETVQPAIELDVCAEEWPLGAGDSKPNFQAIFCANVIHIAPWAVAEGLFRGASGALAAKGFLALYGPFRWHGRHISEGNKAFDDSLRARNPAWGVRDIDAVDRLAGSHRLTRIETAPLPANNHVLIFARSAE